MSRTLSADSEIKGPHILQKNDHRTLIKNVNIFNGTSDKLIGGHDRCFARQHY